MTYYWKCQYNDGSEISSKDFKYKDIDREKLKKFVLLQVDNDKPVLVMNFNRNKHLVCRMRTAKPVMGGDAMTVWIVGSTEHVGRFTKQVICFVFPDGTIEVTDGFKDDHRWFYPVNFLPEEM